MKNLKKEEKTLSDEIKEKAWSMLNNLNNEAEIYPERIQGRYDNRDSTIAARLGVPVGAIRFYLHGRTLLHVANMNKRINKRIKTTK